MRIRTSKFFFSFCWWIKIRGLFCFYFLWSAYPEHMSERLHDTFCPEKQTMKSGRTAICTAICSIGTTMYLYSIFEFALSLILLVNGLNLHFSILLETLTAESRVNFFFFFYLFLQQRTTLSNLECFLWTPLASLINSSPNSI